MVPEITSRSEFIVAGGVRLHVRQWGPPEAPPVFLLHGWMDVSASFQFLVDAWPDARPRRFIAPDWRGFGDSEWLRRPYWFPDYFADLDRLLDHYVPDAPATIVGHSMGGIVAGLYAGIRPERVARLATLEGFGIAATTPDMAPARYRRWLEGGDAAPVMRRHADWPAFRARLTRDLPDVPAARLDALARHLGRELPAAQGGGVVRAGDPWHKRVNPVLYRVEEAMACWQRITAPVLLVTGETDDWLVSQLGSRDEIARRAACFADFRQAAVAGAGHMMHLEQPEALAILLAGFIAPRIA